ncbi:MAG: hypothetical protein KJ630_01260 [Proteobacteria bacterium]|nr:hypothetical protein [Pseudomonadota bacterium]
MKMSGWKTWVAVVCTAGLGVLSIINGDTTTGMQQLVLAFGMLGLGSKIEKASK